MNMDFEADDIRLLNAQGFWAGVTGDVQPGHLIAKNTWKSFGTEKTVDFFYILREAHVTNSRDEDGLPSNHRIFNWIALNEEGDEVHVTYGDGHDFYIYDGTTREEREAARPDPRTELTQVLRDLDT